MSISESKTLLPNEYITCIEVAHQLVRETTMPIWLAMTNLKRLIIFDREKPKQPSPMSYSGDSRRSRESTAGSDDDNDAPKSHRVSKVIESIYEEANTDEYLKSRRASSNSFHEYKNAEGDIEYQVKAAPIQYVDASFENTARCNLGESQRLALVADTDVTFISHLVSNFYAFFGYFA
eukprot:NODE_400_length_9358_cov_0.345070.p2 type:complete len:178 gc:universal NODE_400_length_9358_cov_0.345070:7367-7900(+)